MTKPNTCVPIKKKAPSALRVRLRNAEMQIAADLD